LINLIVCVDLSSGIGYKNELLIKLSADMKRFRELTIGNYVAMGRKTYESIGNPLSQRMNIILTRDKNYKTPTGMFVYHSIEQVIHDYQHQNNNESELFILGGSDIFKQSWQYADRIYLTEIEHRFPKKDSYFIPVSSLEWKLIEEERHEKDEKNPYNYSFKVFERRKYINNKSI
jgi:dihydrofolate reductase